MLTSPVMLPLFKLWYIQEGEIITLPLIKLQSMTKLYGNFKSVFKIPPLPLYNVTKPQHSLTQVLLIVSRHC